MLATKNGSGHQPSSQLAATQNAIGLPPSSRKQATIASFSLAAIGLHLLLRFGVRSDGELFRLAGF